MSTLFNLFVQMTSIPGTVRLKGNKTMEVELNPDCLDFNGVSFGYDANGFNYEDYIVKVFIHISEEDFVLRLDNQILRERWQDFTKYQTAFPKNMDGLQDAQKEAQNWLYEIHDRIRKELGVVYPAHPRSLDQNP